MKSLFKISLIISIVGIMLLLLLSNFLEPKLVKVKDVDSSLLDKKVKIQGTTFKIENYKDSNFQVISIKDETGKIDITTDKILNLTKNQTIIAIGKVNDYKGNLQINADKILLAPSIQ